MHVRKVHFNLKLRGITKEDLFILATYLALMLDWLRFTVMVRAQRK